MNKPLALSLIIPAYNEEKHLKACLEAVAVQSVMPIEVIVVNNNSTDDTVAIAGQYPFVRVINEKRQGIVYGRNAGFDAAKGQILGRIDADSILPPHWVASVLDFYKNNPALDIAFTGGGKFYNVPLPSITSWVLDQVAFRLNRLLLGHYILYGSNMAIPKRVWEQVSDDACVRTDIHEDLDLAIHVHRAGVPISYHAGVQVGVKMRRVFRDHDKLWGNMMMWPQTLRIHGLKRWIWAWVGGFLLYVFTPLLYPFKAAQLAWSWTSNRLRNL
jgi:glycosyltransferase involved in cell wall biosynthesis